MTVRGFAHVTTKDMQAAISALDIIDKGLAKEWRKHAKQEIAKPFAAELARQAPPGSKGAAAARSITTGSGPLPVIYVGRGSWDGWQPFFALEFGMHHHKYHTYIGNRAGKRFVVRRRVGTWAPPWVKGRGLWFYPYWEKHLPEQRAKVVRLADAFIRERLL